MRQVSLNIRSLRDGTETTNIYTLASMKKKKDAYDFVFDSPDEKAFDAKKLRLSVNSNGLSLRADGTSRLADIVLEKGKKHYCYFRKSDDTEALTVGIDTYRVTSDMSDDGGSIEVEFYMDHNCSGTSKNLMKVTVRPKA